jgi:hypothetical protein
MVRAGAKSSARRCFPSNFAAKRFGFNFELSKLLLS